ncbi:10842_t:CDS:2, partial [Cetraspora pellucida]
MSNCLQETHNDLDITSNSEDITLAIKASKNINFEDDGIVVDNEDIDFNFVNNENIGFAFDNSSDISFTPDNDENTNVNNNDNGHGQCTSIIWEFFSEEKNENQEVVAI